MPHSNWCAAKRTQKRRVTTESHGTPLLTRTDWVIISFRFQFLLLKVLLPFNSFPSKLKYWAEKDESLILGELHYMGLRSEWVQKRAIMSVSRPSVHPVEAPPLTDVAAQNALRVRMKDVQGMPGTAGSLLLRLCQLVFAGVSLAVMASTNDFPSVTAFW